MTIGHANSCRVAKMPTLCRIPRFPDPDIDPCPAAEALAKSSSDDEFKIPSRSRNGLHPVPVLLPIAENNQRSVDEVCFRGVRMDWFDKTRAVYAADRQVIANHYCDAWRYRHQRHEAQKRSSATSSSVAKPLIGHDPIKH